MLGKWCAAGQSEHRFWLQTPRTIHAVLDAQWEHLEWQNEMAITQAWLTARLSLSDPKKFPTLDKLTGKRRGPKRQTPEEMLAAVRMLKAAFTEDNDNG